MSPDDVETYRLLYGRDPPGAALGLAHASAAAGVLPSSDDSSPEPMSIDDITSETLREALLGALALAHGRVLSGRFGQAPGEQAGLDKVLAMIGDFPALAKAVDHVADYRRPVAAAKLVGKAASAAPKTASETVRRLRVVLGK